MICVYCDYSEGCEAKTLKECRLFKEKMQDVNKSLENVLHYLSNQGALLDEAIKMCNETLNKH